ncbi:hypothetical protein AX14_011219, partial [Amanita brunnescens Koide BX004]
PSGLSMANISGFLSLKLVQSLCLSFHTAKDLRSWAEMLPKGPQWMYKPWEPAAPTKRPLVLYYRDPLKCLQSLLHAPFIADQIHFTPLRVFESARRLARVYSEWRTGDAAWEMQ